MTFKTTRHEYWNAARDKLVEPGSPDAAFLAFPTGTELTDADARKWGLVKDAEPESAPGKAEPEKARVSVRNKMSTPVPNKSAVRDGSDEETL